MSTKAIGDAVPAPEAIEEMKKKGGDWYAYQNHALDSQECGRLTFLACGPQCSYKEPPERLPDTHMGTGWKYVLIGKVNIEEGTIEPIEKETP